MCSSAAPEAGGLTSAAQEIRNDKSNKDAGQRTPGDFAISDPGPPTTKLHHKNAGKNTKPSDSQLASQPQRVSIADSPGASPVSSALDHSARRDPGGAIITLTRNGRP